MNKPTTHALLALAFAATAHAQIQTIASETFEYPTPGLLGNQNGGVGFADSWDVGANGNEIVMFDQSILAFSAADAVGSYAGQAIEWGTALRDLDPSLHPDVADAVGFGADGSTLWISFSSVAYQVFGEHLGGLTLMDLSGTEELFIGSPWATYAWGIDDYTSGAQTVPFTSSANGTRLVVRIDFMPGDERVQLWLDPAAAHPATAADLDTMVPDFRFGQIRLQSGGSGSNYFWDNIVIEKGDVYLGTPFCSGATNSTGVAGRTRALGTGTIAANDIVLQGSNLPPAFFGIFLTSRVASSPAPIASGFLCLGGAVGRYQGPGLILQIDPAGNIELPIDLGAMPQGAGFVPANAGETWYFQAWHRDITGGVPTSNFTTGIGVTFQ